jgi:hypothetical protein
MDIIAVLIEMKLFDYTENGYPIGGQTAPGALIYLPPNIKYIVQFSSDNEGEWRFLIQS